MHSYLLDLKFFGERKKQVQIKLCCQIKTETFPKREVVAETRYQRKGQKEKKKRIEPFEKDISSHLLTYENDDPF